MTLRARVGLVTLLFFFVTAWAALFSSPVQAASPITTAGSSCGGRVSWKLVDDSGATVSQGSKAKYVNVCFSGFASHNDIRKPFEGVTMEVAWSEWNPFRQRLAGWTVFYQDLGSNLQITGLPGNYTACTNLGVGGGWAHDEYCSGSGGFTGCLNALELTCNQQAQRFWTPDNQPYGNTQQDAWNNVIAPAMRGEDISQGREGSTKEDVIDPFGFCKQVPGDLQDACIKCVGESPEDSKRIYTAIGCIRTDNKGLAEDVVRFFLGIVGGVAMLFLIAAGFIFTTSQGDTNKVKQAKEMMTAAISGVFFIIFSIFILQFVGVSILRIPGLG